MSAPVLCAAEAADPALSGGKAAALARLVAAGFDVPPFVVLADAFFDAAPDMAEVLALVHAEVGAGPYAVRSSAVGEDGAEASHAGQFLSLLDVPAAALADAARRVRASGVSAGLAGYRAAMGEREAKAPAAIVQAMAPARAAGVAFSADPVSGRRDMAVVSAVAGLGDRLVGGEIDGETWRMDRRTGVAVCDAASGVLTAKEAAEVAALAVKIEAAFGRPQDVEWAFVGDSLCVLQARPITTALRDAVADPAVAVLDNSNIVESYPGIVSPLTFSFARYAYARVYVAFAAMLGAPATRIAAARGAFENMLVRVDGRVYYRLDNWRRALALLPGYRLNRDFMDAMMGLDEPFPAGVLPETTPARGLEVVGEAFKVLKALVVFGGAAVRLARTKRDFEQRFQAAVGEPAQDIAAMPASELVAFYRRIEASLLDRWDAPLVNDFLCMIAFGATRKLLEKRLGAQGGELHNAYMIGQGDVISARPARLIERIAGLIRNDPAVVAALGAGDLGALRARPEAQALALEYLREFGDRCVGELKLESRTLHDDPGLLTRAIAAAAARKAAPARATVDAEAEIRARLPAALRFVLMLLLGYAKRRVRDRENLRFERTRIFGRARAVFRALGHRFHEAGLIDAPDDVFQLTVQECLGAVEGGGVDLNLRALAEMRRREAAAFPTEAPPARIVVSGLYPAALGVAAPVAARPLDAATSRQGVGCSAGSFRGVARVVADPASATIAEGEALVAHSTDPGWIALFANAGAVVVERGSPLSHSAIVARELGIPCVVALKGATRWLADGDLIAVDGASGVVEKLT